jgi:glycosyltransferase involved in cell wall biosynthesis
MPNISICITTHNRHETATKCVAMWRKHLPKGAKLIIVDDGSDAPFPGAAFRFETPQGIAAAKNKCLDMAGDAEHIFLSDDDCWPVTPDWWQPYVNSPEPHLMFTFSRLKDGRQNGNRTVLSSNGLVQYSNPCGCMLYVHKNILQLVGGFDTRFNRYGHEHVEWSNRIHNAGLTKFRYQDVPNSLELFHSMDWACEIKSSVQAGRGKMIAENARHFARVAKSVAYIPYKQLPNVIITTYFTGSPDPQRGESLPNVADDIYPLYQSLRNHGIQLVVLHDNLNGPDTALDAPWRFIRVKPAHHNPYYARWFAIAEHLQTHEYNYVWCVDATDVTMLRNPFPHMEPDRLYLGDEQGTRVSNPWLTKHHPQFASMYRAIGNKWLLNAGLVGGTSHMVHSFCEALTGLLIARGFNCGLTDMATFNYVAYQQFAGALKHGPQVNTIFKKYADNGLAWFKHK